MYALCCLLELCYLINDIMTNLFDRLIWACSVLIIGTLLVFCILRAIQVDKDVYLAMFALLVSLCQSSLILLKHVYESN